MLNLFNDTDHSKVRQSVFVAGGLIIFICQFQVGIRLPELILEVDPNKHIISPEKSVQFLGLVYVYLLARYIAMQISLITRYQAGLGRETEVEKKAEHYSGQISRLLDKLNTKPFADVSAVPKTIANQLSDFADANELKESALKQFFITMVPVGMREQLQQEAMEEANRPYSTAIAVIREQSKFAEEVTDGLGRVHSLLESYRELAELPELKHYRTQRTAEMVSGRWEGRDKFILANIGVLVILIMVVYNIFMLFRGA